ncbi:hypothetical protein ANANG_G00025170 [Anguilla anguilla]|uniref:Ig-like domain-containing protein n=1 Tax=Anguilla anguilla TaxID=7936 RepID=A0A9D3N266_ANGAN|nr:hypothetical protein ANANG_G00025170 [Anguilla anguilla]
MLLCCSSLSVAQGASMIVNVIRFTLSLACLSSSVVCITVLQSPPELVLHRGEAVTLNCSHDDSNFDRLYWYKQTDGAGLELQGYLSFKQPYTEVGSFNVSGDGEKEGFLKSSAVTAEESGVYFCAVSKTQCCLANGVKFDEQVPVRTARPGERVEIACSHDDSSLLVMSWYEQRERSRALRLIGSGYSTAEPTYEDPFAARFQLRRESVQKGSLLISNVTMADSAEYFCAARVSSSPVVLQTEAHLTPSPGDTVTLRCSMAAGFSMSGYTMYWYRQARAGAPIEFLKKEYDTSGRRSGSPCPSPPRRTASTCGSRT